ncbi:MAG: hypothetical protein ACXVLQ_04800 [Bacteriovorax sp.]
MMDFLSDVFEFEVDAVSESICRGPLFIKLCQLGPHLDPPGKSGIVFSFVVKSEMELKEIMSKYNFFLYRKASAPNTLEKIELSQNENKTTLTIVDIDQRLWRFECEKRMVI